MIKIRSSPFRRVGFSIRNIAILVLIGVILYFGAFWQIFDPRPGATAPSDVDKYQCYEVAFWQGASGLHALPEAQCQFLTASSEPFRTLPKEYPFLVLIPLSLPLLLSPPLYKVGFALLMFLAICSIFALLRAVRSSRTAFTFLIYLVLGCLGTAEGRFDLLPSVCTFAALILAERRRWNWASALLAIATLLKLYPLILFIPFLIAQQTQIQGKRLSWKRVQPLCIYIALCAGISIISLLLSVDGTLGPLSYFEFRPLQIESLSASIVWLIGTIAHLPLTYVYSFGSRNIVSSFSAILSSGMSFLLLCGLVYIAWLQWRGKISLAWATLLTLLVLLLTGKVFSAQYLIWVVPFVAYVGESNWRWLLGWGLVSLLTTLIYPFIYEQAHFPFLASLTLPPLMPTILVRNILLLVFTLILLVQAVRHISELYAPIPSSDSSQTGD